MTRKTGLLFTVFALATALFSAVALADAINGDDNANKLKGTNGPDQIDAKGGDDRVKARAGADEVRGGEGSDRVDGGRGADTLNGDAGDDRLKGGRGKDTLNGDAGDDRINGRGDGGRSDTITCGDGTDVVRADRFDAITDPQSCEDLRVAGGKGKHKGQQHKKAKAHEGPKQED